MREAPGTLGGTAVPWIPGRHKLLETRQVVMGRSMEVAPVVAARRVEPLYGVGAAAREQPQLTQLQVVRPCSEALEPRVQVCQTHQGMRELSQVAEDRGGGGFRRRRARPHLQEAQVQLGTSE